MRTLLLLLSASILLPGIARAQSLADAIRHGHPTATPNVDFVIEDRADGKGAVLIKWDAVKLGARPTPEQIAAWKTAVAADRDQKQRDDKAENTRLDELIAKAAARTLNPNERDEAIERLLRALKRQRAGESRAAR